MAVAQDADLRGNMNTACLTSLRARRLSTLATIIDWLSQVRESFLPRRSIGVLAQVPYRSQSIDKRGEEALPAGLLRLSVGIEDVDDLWRDLDSALRSSTG